MQYIKSTMRLGTIGNPENIANLIEATKNVTIVSESGISTVDDLKRLNDTGIRSALIGEHFMKSEQPGKALRELLDGLGRETAR